MPSPLDPASRKGSRARRALRTSAALLALVIFAIDTFTPLEGAVAVLYVVVVLLAARTGRRGDIIVAAGVGIVFTLAAYVAAHGFSHTDSAVVRALVSLAAIGITALLALQHRAGHAALLRSERRYRRMFDASQVGVLEEDWSGIRAALDGRGLRDASAVAAHVARTPAFVSECRRLARIVGVNPAFRAMVGPDTPRDTVDDLLVDADRTFATALAAFAAGQRAYESETAIRRADGSILPVILAITFPCAEDGDPDGIVLVFVLDVTERQRAHDALLIAQADLAHAARLATLGEFSASIAHEVNQPLMAVVTNGEAALRWLDRDPPVLDEVEAGLRRIVSEARRAADIVARTRAFLTKTPMERDTLDVAVLVEESARLVERELARADVDLRLDLAADTPLVRGDRVQLQQILVNLMMNAGQAMATTAAPRVLTVGTTRAGETVEIAVSDTGPGIAESDMPWLFDRFFTTRAGGMGMGLAISRTTAEAHGGSLSVESAPGAGATFRLILPDGGERKIE